MLEKEVDYRIAKWLLLNMEKDGIITSDELRLAWINIAEHYILSSLSLATAHQRSSSSIPIQWILCPCLFSFWNCQ